jgi:hypothetical protein
MKRALVFVAVSQLHQPVSQELQCPVLPTVWRLALGQSLQNGFLLLIQLLLPTRTRARRAPRRTRGR